MTGCACVYTRMQFCTLGALTLQLNRAGESTEMSTVHGVIHTSIVCVYKFRRGFCTSVLSLLPHHNYNTYTIYKKTSTPFTNRMLVHQLQFALIPALNFVVHAAGVWMFKCRWWGGVSCAFHIHISLSVNSVRNLLFSCVFFSL